MIICEGTDLTGKTTLARYLSKQLRAPTRHLGKPLPGQRHYDVVKDAMYNDPNHTIYDRICLGSYVYGQLLKDEFNVAPVTLDELTHWSCALHALGGVLVWCRAEPDVITERYGRDGDEYLTLDVILQAAELYENAVRMLRKVAPPGLQILVYNSGLNTPIQFFQARTKTLRRALSADRVSHAILDKCFNGQAL